MRALTYGQFPGGPGRMPGAGPVPARSPGRLGHWWCGSMVIRVARS